ncbi:hypothetical protein QOZ80_3BG0265580 [Eleusine coracana subsp. coracana]|nr:hypothetical protein QOZ80_3BG0265580 [Eleusine coracana subsp. coracana]
MAGLEPMQGLVILVLAVLSGLCRITAAAPANANDAAAMHSIANTTGAAKSLGWGMKSADPCDGTWAGVRCNGEGRVTSIIANRAGLGGGLHGSDLSKLSFLEELDVSFNTISGYTDSPDSGLPLLPTPLQYLRSLDLRSNHFFDIPAKGFFAGFPALETITLDDNPMADPKFRLDVLTCSSLRSFSANNVTILQFPAFFGYNIAFPVLETLSLARNQIMGHIPPSFGNNSSIKYLDISDQKDVFGNPTLVGRIDNFIPGMVSLVEVRLDHNDLAGPLPDASKLVNLLVFNAADNHLCGVPNFPDGTSVDLTGNQAVGQVC